MGQVIVLSPIPCDNRSVSLRQIFRGLLSVCIVLMLLGPVACATASAAHSLQPQAVNVHSMDAHSIRADAMDDMDCCPGKHPPPCEKCPLMALCSSPAIAASLPEPIAVRVWHVGEKPAPGDEATLVGRAASPPLEPPRS